MTIQKHHLFLRVISGLLVASFFAQDLAMAAPESAAIFSVQKTSAVRVELPASFGVVEESRSEGKDARTIFVLQDAHTNDSCQASIARTIEFLWKTQGVSRVFLEAGEGDDSLTALREKGSAAAREEVGRRWMKRGELKGCEYLDLVSDLPLKLWGVEDGKLYSESVSIYADIVAGRKGFQSYLDGAAAAIRALKPRIFNPLLIGFDSTRAAYRQGTKSASDYAGYLARQAPLYGLSMKDFPHVALLRELKKKEDAIDFAAANAEQAKLLASLPAGEAREFVSKAAAFGGVSAGSGDEEARKKSFYALLESEVDRDRARYPQLARYTDYLKKAAAIDPKALLGEIEGLEKGLAGALMSTGDEKNLWTAERGLEKLRLLFDLKLSPAEFAAYRADDGRFNVEWITGFLNRKIADLGTGYENWTYLREGFGPYVTKAGRFYELTRERDEAFVKNALEKMKAEGETKAVLIAGGYHSPNLKEILRRENVSYVCITPQTLKETDHARYEKILLERSRLSREASAASAVSAESGRAADKNAELAIRQTPGAAARLTAELIQWDDLRGRSTPGSEDSPRFANTAAARLASGPARSWGDRFPRLFYGIFVFGTTAASVFSMALYENAYFGSIAAAVMAGMTAAAALFKIAGFKEIGSRVYATAIVLFPMLYLGSSNRLSQDLKISYLVGMGITAFVWILKQVLVFENVEDAPPPFIDPLGPAGIDLPLAEYSGEDWRAHETLLPVSSRVFESPAAVMRQIAEVLGPEHARIGFGNFQSGRLVSYAVPESADPAGRAGKEARRVYEYLQQHRNPAGWKIYEMGRGAEKVLIVVWRTPSSRPEDGARLSKNAQPDEEYRLRRMRVYLPPSLPSRLTVRWGRYEGGAKVYTREERAKGRDDHEFIEFASSKEPHKNLTVRLTGDGKAISAVLESPGRPAESAVIDAEETSVLTEYEIGRHFMDDVLEIPRENSPERARAIRDFLIALDAAGRASRRNGAQNLGLRSATFRVPRGITDGSILVQMLAERDGRARFVLLQDRLDPGLFIVFESTSSRVLDASTGAVVPTRLQQDGVQTLIAPDYAPLGDFLRRAGRSLLHTVKGENGVVYPLRQTGPFKHELGFSRKTRYSIIKVNASTSVSTTGLLGSGRRETTPFSADDLEGYPIYVFKPAVAEDEPVPARAISSLVSDPSYCVFDASILSDWPAFLGHERGGRYQYFKLLKGRPAFGVPRVVYRLIDESDANYLLHASMQGDGHFRIAGVTWNEGPEKGQEIRLRGRITLAMLVAKYARTGSPVAVPVPVAREFAPDLQDPNVRKSRYLTPQAVFDIDSRLFLEPGPAGTVTEAGLSEAAREEGRRLREAASGGARLAADPVGEWWKDYWRHDTKLADRYPDEVNRFIEGSMAVFGPSPEGNFIDLGAGNLHHSFWLKQKFPRLQVHALDLVPAPGAASRGISYHEGSMEDTKLPAAGYDGFLLSWSLDYTDMPAATAEAGRITRDGGFGIVVLHHPESGIIHNIVDKAALSARSKAALDYVAAFVEKNQPIDLQSAGFQSFSSDDRDKIRQIAGFYNPAPPAMKAALRDHILAGIAPDLENHARMIAVADRLRRNVFRDPEAIRGFFERAGFDAAPVQILYRAGRPIAYGLVVLKRPVGAGARLSIWTDPVLFVADTIRRWNLTQFLDYWPALSDYVRLAGDRIQALRQAAAVLHRHRSSYDDLSSHIPEKMLPADLGEEPAVLHRTLRGNFIKPVVAEDGTIFVAEGYLLLVPAEQMTAGRTIFTSHAKTCNVAFGTVRMKDGKLLYLVSHQYEHRFGAETLAPLAGLFDKGLVESADLKVLAVRDAETIRRQLENMRGEGRKIEYEVREHPYGAALTATFTEREGKKRVHVQEWSLRGLFPTDYTTVDFSRGRARTIYEGEEPDSAPGARLANPLVIDSKGLEPDVVFRLRELARLLRSRSEHSEVVSLLRDSKDIEYVGSGEHVYAVAFKEKPGFVFKIFRRFHEYESESSGLAHIFAQESVRPFVRRQEIGGLPMNYLIARGDEEERPIMSPFVYFSLDGEGFVAEPLLSEDVTDEDVHHVLAGLYALGIDWDDAFTGSRYFGARDRIRNPKTWNIGRWKEYPVLLDFGRMSYVGGARLAGPADLQAASEALYRARGYMSVPAFDLSPEHLLTLQLRLGPDERAQLPTLMRDKMVFVYALSQMDAEMRTLIAGIPGDARFAQLKREILVLGALGHLRRVRTMERQLQEKTELFLSNRPDVVERAGVIDFAGLGNELAAAEEQLILAALALRTEGTYGRFSLPGEDLPNEERFLLLTQLVRRYSRSGPEEMIRFSDFNRAATDPGFVEFAKRAGVLWNEPQDTIDSNLVREWFWAAAVRGYAAIEDIENPQKLYDEIFEDNKSRDFRFAFTLRGRQRLFEYWDRLNGLLGAEGARLATREPQFNYVKNRSLSLPEGHAWHPYNSPSYDGVLSATGIRRFSGRLKPFVELLTSLIEEKAGREGGPLVWADIGPGQGIAMHQAKKLFGDRLKTYGADVVDWFAESYATANQRTAYEKNYGEGTASPANAYQFVKGSVETVVLPEPPDFISAIYVLPYSEDPMKAFENLYNQLKPGGTMVLSLFANLAPLPGALIQDYSEKNWYVALVAELRRNGVEAQRYGDVIFLKKPDARRLSIRLLHDPEKTRRNGEDQVTVYYTAHPTEPLMTLSAARLAVSDERLADFVRRAGLLREEAAAWLFPGKPGSQAETRFREKIDSIQNMLDEASNYFSGATKFQDSFRTYAVGDALHSLEAILHPLGPLETIFGQLEADGLSTAADRGEGPGAALRLGISGLIEQVKLAAGARLARPKLGTFTDVDTAVLKQLVPAVKKSLKEHPERPVLILLSGDPGAGKSTLSEAISLDVRKPTPYGDRFKNLGLPTSGRATTFRAKVAYVKADKIHDAYGRFFQGDTVFIEEPLTEPGIVDPSEILYADREDLASGRAGLYDDYLTRFIGGYLGKLSERVPGKRVVLMEEALLDFYSANLLKKPIGEDVLVVRMMVRKGEGNTRQVYVEEPVVWNKAEGAVSRPALGSVPAAADTPPVDRVALEALLLEKAATLEPGARSADFALFLSGERPDLFYFDRPEKDRAALRMRGVDAPLVSLEGDLRALLEDRRRNHPGLQNLEAARGLLSLLAKGRAQADTALPADLSRSPLAHEVPLDALRSVEDKGRFAAQARILVSQIASLHGTRAFRGDRFFVGSALQDWQKDVIAAEAAAAGLSDSVRTEGVENYDGAVVRYVVTDNLSARPGLDGRTILLPVGGLEADSLAGWYAAFKVGGAVGAVFAPHYESTAAGRTIHFDRVHAEDIPQNVVSFYKTREARPTQGLLLNLVEGRLLGASADEDLRVLKNLSFYLPLAQRIPIEVYVQAARLATLQVGSAA